MESMKEVIEIYKNGNNELEDLYKNRRYAFVGTVGGIALMAANITLTNDTNYFLATTGAVIFPYAAIYLNNIQSQINKTLILKKECLKKIEKL